MEPDTKRVATMEPLRITEVIGAFVVLAAGLVFSAIVWVLELKKYMMGQKNTKVSNFRKEPMLTSTTSVKTMDSFFS